MKIAFRNSAVMILGLLAMPHLAGATVIFSDGFEDTGETGSVLNWDGGDNWDILSGSVDLIKQGNPWGIDCVGDTGFCIDMDGSTSDAGDMASMNLGPLAAGEYILSFDLSGNQRDPGWTDTVVAYIEFGHASWSESLAWNAGWSSYSYTFEFTSVADPVFLRFAATGGDNVGMILDNVQLARVPEPGTLALLGLGLLGMSASRKKRVRA